MWCIVWFKWKGFSRLSKAKDPVGKGWATSYWKANVLFSSLFHSEGELFESWYSVFESNLSSWRTREQHHVKNVNVSWVSKEAKNVKKASCIPSEKRLLKAQQYHQLRWTKFLLMVIPIVSSTCPMVQHRTLFEGCSFYIRIQQAEASTHARHGNN